MLIYTPGRWFVSQGASRLVIDEFGHIIAATEFTAFGPGDAQLTSAVPDLYEACKFYLTVDSANDAALCEEMIRRAVAKAEGKL